MSQTTPGPWHAQGTNIYAKGGANIEGTNGGWIGQTGGGNREIDEANARLIAKAPEMLDSLKSFVKLTDEAEAQARWPSGPWLHFCAARALLAELGEGA